MLAAGRAMAQISLADRTFATKAAAGGEAEVALGRLATEKAGSGQVHQFGQQMVTDHSQANEELQAIARQKNLRLPTKPDAASTATEQRQQASSGTVFDAAYARDMLQDHQQDVADLQKEASSGQDPTQRRSPKSTCRCCSTICRWLSRSAANSSIELVRVPKPALDLIEP